MNEYAIANTKMDFEKMEEGARDELVLKCSAL
jgi:hypothetical protein